MDIKDELINLFTEIGISIDDECYNDELQLDSLQFINIIILIEDTFLFTVGDNYMSHDKLKSFNDFKNMICESIKIS